MVDAITAEVFDTIFFDIGDRVDEFFMCMGLSEADIIAVMMKSCCIKSVFKANRIDMVIQKWGMINLGCLIFSSLVKMGRFDILDKMDSLIIVPKIKIALIERYKKTNRSNND